MSRLMSVSHTEQQVIDRTKTVTRRLGWKNLKPGDTLTLCRKVMGRKKGEPLVRLAEARVTEAHREELWRIGIEDVIAEGLPRLDPDGVHRLLLRHVQSHATHGGDGDPLALHRPSRGRVVRGLVPCRLPGSVRSGCQVNASLLRANALTQARTNAERQGVLL